MSAGEETRPQASDTPAPRKVMVLGGFPESLVVFRGNLLRELVARGHEVVAGAARVDSLSGGYGIDVQAALAELGVRYRRFFLQRTGTNPAQDLRTLASLTWLLAAERPHVVFAYTLKPVIYATLAARACRVPRVYGMLTGLGSVLREGGKEARLAHRALLGLLRVALARDDCVFFQNPDDPQDLLRLGVLQPHARTLVVNGSGVDIERFRPAPPVETPVTFLLIARLLRDKGVVEYAEAAAQVRAQCSGVRFLLVGPLDSNPMAVSADQVRAWQDGGILEYAGMQQDVRPWIAQSTVYVLPSYHEGAPRTVLEAMAMARPVITTDAPGCRQTVVPGENGFLVPVRDADALAEAMMRFVRDPSLIAPMGRRSRQLAEERYDVRKVNAAVMRAMGLA